MSFMLKQTDDPNIWDILVAVQKKLQAERDELERVSLESWLMCQRGRRGIKVRDRGRTIGRDCKDSKEKAKDKWNANAEAQSYM